MRKTPNQNTTVTPSPSKAQTESIPAPFEPNYKDYYIWDRGQRLTLSNFFLSTEFDCHCGECKRQFINKELVEKLTFIRAMLNIPIRINSGYRCESYQKKLKKQGLETAVGVSQHSLGNAADISPSSLAQMLNLTIMAEKEFMAIGAGKSFIHVDLRKDKIRRWTYAI